MTDRERDLVRLRTLLDAADILLSEANRWVPTNTPGDTEADRQVRLDIHSQIQTAQRGINAATFLTTGLKK